MPKAATPAQMTLVLYLMGIVLIAWIWAFQRIATGGRLLPDRPPRLVPWRANAVLGVLLIWVGLLVVAPPLYIGIAGVERVRPGGVFRLGPADKIFITLAASLPMVPIAWLALKRMAGATAADFGLERQRIAGDVLRGLIAWPLLAPIVMGINSLALALTSSPDTHPAQAWGDSDPSPLTWTILAVSTTVVAPLAEEFLFRGVLLGWLGRVVLLRGGGGTDDPGPGATGPRLSVANIAVSLLFAGLHGQVWPSPVPLFFLSLGLGVLYQRTGGLAAPVVLHATFNGVSTLILALGSLHGGQDRAITPPPAWIGIDVAARTDRNARWPWISMDSPAER